MDKMKLLPCPFCGSFACIFYNVSEKQFDSCYVACRNLDCKISSPSYASEQLAIKAWNRRV